MAFYNFKKNCKVYLVSSSKYKIEVYPDLTFGQTFEEKAVNVKTLHAQNAMFEHAIINKANPATFSFTVYLSTGNDFIVLGDLLTKNGADEALNSCDIYVDTGVDIFKITKGVFGRATFQINKNQIITVSLEGTASKLNRFGPSGTVIPGTTATRDASTVPAIIPHRLLVELNGEEVKNVAGVTLELTNDVSWVDYTSLHKSLYVTNASDSQYPERFVVSKKVLSGTIQQYLTDENRGRVQTWSTNIPLRIRVGTESQYFLDVNMPGVVYTNRLEVSDLFLQNYDFRMVYSPSEVSDVLGYNL
jgi:hypothetical protein